MTREEIRLQVAISALQGVLEAKLGVVGEALPSVAVEESLRIADEFVKQWFNEEGVKNIEQEKENPKDSEEDNTMKEIIQFFKDASNGKTRVIASGTFVKWAEFLEGQNEWSDADKIKIVELKTFIAQCNGFNKANRQKAFDMIDAIRTQPHWKPSDEQMNILDKVYHYLWADRNATADMQDGLGDFIDELKFHYSL